MIRKLLYAFLFLLLMFQVLRTDGQQVSFYTMPVTGIDTIHTCYGRFFDSGGRYGNYSNNENGTVIICPPNSGQYAAIVFAEAEGTISFATANSNDFMKIYNGVGIGGTLLAMLNFSGAAECASYYSTDSTGCLTVTFQSDGNSTGIGWHAFLYCQPTSSINHFPGYDCSLPFLVPSLPYTLNRELTDCYDRNYGMTTPGACQSPYSTGHDKVYIYNASGPECLTVTLNNASTDYVGIQVYHDCPGSGGNCLAWYGGATGGFLTSNINLPSAGTYFIMINVACCPPAPVHWIEYDISLSTCVVGINEANYPASFILSPNPGIGFFSLQTNSYLTNANLTITNTLGEKIHEQKVVSEKTEINLSNHPSGIYFVAVRDEKNNLVVRKIVKM